MPIINVQIVEGRSEEQVKQLIASMTSAAVESLGVRPEQVRVLVTEIPDSHWGVGGITKKERDKQ